MGNSQPTNRTGRQATQQVRKKRFVDGQISNVVFVDLQLNKIFRCRQSRAARSCFSGTVVGSDRTIPFQMIPIIMMFFSQHLMRNRNYQMLRNSVFCHFRSTHWTTSQLRFLTRPYRRSCEPWICPRTVLKAWTSG